MQKGDKNVEEVTLKNVYYHKIVLTLKAAIAVIYYSGEQEDARSKSTERTLVDLIFPPLPLPQPRLIRIIVKRSGFFSKQTGKDQTDSALATQMKNTNAVANNAPRPLNS